MVSLSLCPSLFVSLSFIYGLRLPYMCDNMVSLSRSLAVACIFLLAFDSSLAHSLAPFKSLLSSPLSLCCFVPSLCFSFCPSDCPSLLPSLLSLPSLSLFFLSPLSLLSLSPLSPLSLLSPSALSSLSSIFLFFFSPLSLFPHSISLSNSHLL